MHSVPAHSVQSFPRCIHNASHTLHQYADLGKVGHDCLHINSKKWWTRYGYKGLARIYNVWRGGATSRVFDLINRSWVQMLLEICVTTLGKLFTPMCLYHQAV